MLMSMKPHNLHPIKIKENLIIKQLIIIINKATSKLLYEQKKKQLQRIP